MKRILLILIFFIPAHYIMSEELLFRIIQDTPAWLAVNRTTISRDDSSLTLKQGTIVKGFRPRFTRSRIDNDRYFLYTFILNNTQYEIQADMLVPANTESLFDDSWINNFNSQNGKFWIQSGYLNVLLSKNREKFHDIDRSWIDVYNRNKETNEYMMEEWYEIAGISYFELNQITLYAGGFGSIMFWITNIIKINTGYKVTVHDHMLGTEFSIFDDLPFDNQLSFPIDRRSFDLVLKLDNNYLDIYLDNEENHFATFVRADENIMNELNKLMRTNNINFSKINYWPRRADGSMDYPPPAGVVLSQTYDDFIFDNETTDNIDEEIADNIDSHESAMAQDSTEKSSMPLPLLLAIIGGFVVIAGVVVVVRKKK